MSIEKKSKAVEKLEENAEKGEVLSAFQLFENYRDGKFVLQDDAMAEQYLEQCFEYLQELNEHKTLKNRFRLEKLDLVDFRRFERLVVKLHPKLTVLIGDNGSGKTSILEAIYPALAWITDNINKEDTNSSRFKPEDVNNKSQSGYADIETTFSFGKGLNKLSATMSVEKGLTESNRHSDVAGLKKIADLWRVTNAKRVINLPLMGYYSTRRTYDDFRTTESSLRLNRYDAYKDSYDSNNKSFKNFLAWYASMQKRAAPTLKLMIEIKQLIVMLEQGNPALNGFIKQKQDELDALMSSDLRVSAVASVKLVDDVICRCVSGISGLRFDDSSGVDTIWIQNEGVEVVIGQLSDGQRTLIALVADIARRLILLNPKLDNPLEGQGIVLIDEIELHLHPKWQQGVLLNLQKSFPNIQFIVTTHSPQVLSTVKRESIRVLSEDFAQEPLAETYGYPSGDVLHAVMSVNSTPATIPEIEGLKLLTRWVDQGFYADKKTIDLMQDLEEKLGRGHPQLSMLRRNIERQKVLNQ